VIPFTIATLATTLKAMGAITLAQRTNDAEWVRPEMGSTRRGVLADGLTIALAGLAGTYGTNTSSANVAMASATGVTSRRVAFATGAVFLVLGFVPLLATLVALMPRPVMAAALLFAACFLLVNGMQIITSRMLDTRKTLVIGLASLAGLAVEIFPAGPGIHPMLAPLMSSSLVTGTLAALALNLAFRIGLRQTVRLVITPEPGTATEIENFFKRHGAAWGARPDVVNRATFATVQLAETVGEHCAPKGPIELQASFDEFNLDVRMAYEGEPLEFPMTRPTNDEIRTSADGLRRLAGYMLRRNANRIDSTFGAGRVSVHFHFDH
jgi:NCS2 family nucleobase:cation symporter-2